MHKNAFVFLEIQRMGFNKKFTFLPFLTKTRICGKIHKEINQKEITLC